MLIINNNFEVERKIIPNKKEEKEQSKFIFSKSFKTPN